MTRNSVTLSSPSVETGAAGWAARGEHLAWLAAAAWILLGLESILRPGQHNERDVWWTIPFALTTAAFCCLHAVQTSRNSGAERWGFYAVLGACILVFAGNAGIVLGVPSLAVLGFPWGAVVWTAGLVMFGVGTWRAGVLPRYVAAALIALEPGSILTGLALAPVSPLQNRGAYSGGVEKGFVLAILAMGLRTLSRSPHSD
jgi:hypothetical protein